MATTKKEVASDEQEQTVQTTEAQSDATAQAEKILADAKAEADKILADAKAKAAAGAEAAKDTAKAEADKILADAKAKAAAGAEAAKDTAKAEADIPVDPGERLVSIRLFKDNDKYKDDVFVAVNGERVQIRRGETVLIKKKFADVLEQSMKQDVATANMIERESSEFEAKAAALKL